MSDNKRKILKSAANGCVDAFEKLIEPYRGVIFNLMLSVCGNEFEASQMAQEVFIRVFGSLSAGMNYSGFKFILFKAAGEISRRAACKSKMIS